MNDSKTKTDDADNRSRFVVLYHEFPAGHACKSHWDLMLEQGDSLETYAICEPLEHGETVEAKRLPNHRKAYLDYEGPVSDDRGSVTRVMKGEYFSLESESSEEKHQQLVLNFDGKRWKLKIEETEMKLLISVSEF